MSKDNMLISLTLQAHNNLKEFPEHLHRRKPEYQFDGTHFVHIPHTTNARGLSDLMLNFLFNPTPLFPSTNYQHSRPYSIIPSTFIDARTPETIQEEYARVNPPGTPPNPFSLIPVYSNPYSYYNYTNWTTGDPTYQYKISDLFLLPHVLHCAYQIAYYWHLSLNRPPTSSKVALSALFNAIGLGYLIHPLLPRPANPAPNVNLAYY